VTGGRLLPLPGAQEQALLVEQIRRGEPSAEERLAGLFHERIRLLALARTRNREAAIELAQDVVMAVLLALRNGHIRESEKLTAFVYGTARNHLNNYFRVRSRTPENDELLPDHVVVEPADPIAEFERLNLVRQALTTLNAEDRKILSLTLVDGLKPGEIAQRLGLSSEVVRARKSRLVKKMVEHVQTLSRT
jgi:RNA polymerase sigma-70 factor (ECF subfamily)